MSISTTAKNQFRKVATPQATIVSSADVNSSEIETLRKANADLKQQVETKQKELENAIALQAARKIQAEHDRAEFIKSKVQAVEQDKTGVSIVRNMPTKEDLVEC